MKIRRLARKRFVSASIVWRVMATTAASLCACASMQAAILQKGSIATLKSTTGMADGDIAIVEGYYSSGDRGGGTFKYYSGASNTDDGGRIIAPNSGVGRWARLLLGETPNVRMWGAKGNGKPSFPGYDANANDTVSIQNAINAGMAGELLFPAGAYRITNTLVFPCQMALRGEGQGNNTHVVMASGVQKDIFRTSNANLLLKGGLYAIGDVPYNYLGEQGDLDHWLVFEKFFIEFEGANYSNSCLVVARPGEAHTIRNIATFGGAFGIRCFGVGAPGLKARDVTVHGASVGGISIEALVLTNGLHDTAGPISLIGVSGDSGGTNASLIRFTNIVATVSITDFKAEQLWGAGLIRYDRSPLTPPNGITDRIGSVHIQGGTYNNSTGTSGDFVVLGPAGNTRTAIVSIDQVNLYGVRCLIRDEVSGRNVLSQTLTFSGLDQTTARIPISYEGFNYGSTNYSNTGGKYSRLISGGKAIYQFAPPQTNAWYRILAPVNTGNTHLGGSLTVTRLGTDSSKIEVDVNPSALTTGCAINVVRTSKDSTYVRPCVTKARAFNFWEGSYSSAYVDVYVERMNSTGYPNLDQIVFALDLDGTEPLTIPQLLTPTSPVSATLPSGYYTSVEVDLVRP